MSAPTSQPKQPKPQSNAELKAQILTRLATALAAASARFQAAAAGQPTFTSDADLKANIALLKLAPALLQFLDPKPAAAARKPLPIAPLRPSYVNLDPTNIPLIPKCTFCGQGPGAHWSDDCPDNPNSTGWNRHLMKRSTPNV